MPQMIRDWPHAPAHRLTASGAYIVTSGTYHGIPIFNSTDRLTYLTNSILDLTEKYNCSLQAWAIFNNHYHLILETAEPASLKTLVRHIHGRTSRYANVLDSTAIRKVWFQYWETRLSYPKSFLARLRYVHANAVRHRLVRAPEAYPWCSAAWFQRNAPKSFHRTVMTFPCDQLAVPDDFDVVGVNMDCGASAPPLQSPKQNPI